MSAAERPMHIWYRDRWHQEHPDASVVPHLEFRTPLCSVCRLETRQDDDGYYVCDPCEAVWPDTDKAGWWLSEDEL